MGLTMQHDYLAYSYAYIMTTKPYYVWQLCHSYILLAMGDNVRVSKPYMVCILHTYVQEVSGMRLDQLYWFHPD